MERGKPLTRRAPLAPGSKGLARGAGLTGGGQLARRASAARSSSTPRVGPEVRDTVLARSQGRCEVGVSPECRARGGRLDSIDGASQHHRLPARMGGSRRVAVHGPGNLLQVCGSSNAGGGCHAHIERHREAAYAEGWLLHAGAVPVEEPLRYWDGRRVLLGHAGDVRAAPDDLDPAYYGR